MKDIIWLKSNGEEMTDAEWGESRARSLGVFLAGEGLTEIDDRGRPLTDASFLVLFSADDEDTTFLLPRYVPDARWMTVMDTAYEDGLVRGHSVSAGDTYPLRARSLVLLQQQLSTHE